MKKFVSCILAAMMVMSFAACDKAETPDDGYVKDPYAQGTETPSNKEDTSATEENKDGEGETSREEEIVAEGKEAMIKELYDNMAQYGNRTEVDYNGKNITLWSAKETALTQSGDSVWKFAVDGLEVTYTLQPSGEYSTSEALYQFVNNAKTEYSAGLPSDADDVAISSTYGGLNSNFFFVTVVTGENIKETLYGARLIDDTVLVTEAILTYTSEETADAYSGEDIPKFVAIDVVMDSAFAISEFDIMNADTQEITSASDLESLVNTENINPSNSEVNAEDLPKVEGAPEVPSDAVDAPEDPDAPAVPKAIEE